VATRDGVCAIARALLFRTRIEGDKGPCIPATPALSDHSSLPMNLFPAMDERPTWHGAVVSPRGQWIMVKAGYESHHLIATSNVTRISIADVKRMDERCTMCNLVIQTAQSIGTGRRGLESVDHYDITVNMPLDEARAIVTTLFRGPQ